MSEALAHTLLYRSPLFPYDVARPEADRWLRERLCAHGSLCNIVDASLWDVESLAKSLKGEKKLRKQIQETQFDLVRGHVAAPVLYLRGDASLLDRHAVGIVGKGEVSKRMVRYALRSLGEQVVIAPLEYGCGALALQQAIARGCRVIGVCTSDLDNEARKESGRLRSYIAERHLLLSQYPFGAPRLDRLRTYVRQTVLRLSDALIGLRCPEGSADYDAICEASRSQMHVQLSKAYVHTGWRDEVGALPLGTSI